MKPPNEFVVRTIENADRTRRLIVSVMQFGATRWKFLRLTNMRRPTPAAGWRRSGYVDVQPQFIDELMGAFDRAFDKLIGNAP
jgi:hypothetical protein